MESVGTDGQLYSDEYFLKLGPRRFVNEKQTNKKLSRSVKSSRQHPFLKKILPVKDGNATSLCLEIEVGRSSIRFQPV